MSPTAYTCIMQRFLDVILQNISGLANFLTPVRYCDEGYNVIRKTFGKPHKVFTTGLCYKLPIIQTFDIVNMKKQVHFLNAHSIKSGNDKVIPYNITIDAQVEFRIIDPMVIYHIDIFDEGNCEPIRIYVDNEVHLIIDEVLKENPIDIQAAIDEALTKMNYPEKPESLNNMIKIERIVISAFDYNLSIRHAQ